MAGFNIVAGIDFDKDSVDTFKHNFPNADAICTDLMVYTEDKIKKYFAGMQIDVIVGGPPCQGFSNANRWQNEKSDPRNKLFFEYLRFVKVLKPRIVVIENVKGILSSNNGYAAKKIVALLMKLGYQCDSKILNAADYGVPQNRERTFFVAVKQSSKADIFQWDKIEKLERINVKEAISELYKFDNLSSRIPIISAQPKTNYQVYLRHKNNELHNHEPVYPAKLTQERISNVPQGGNWQDIPKKLFKNNRTNRHSSAFKRLSEKDQSVTIDTGNAHSNYFHPIYNRIPTVREAARIQSFQDNFIFKGSRTSQYRQVGNAVPPLLAKALAKAIRKHYF